MKTTNNLLRPIGPIRPIRLISLIVLLSLSPKAQAQDSLTLITSSRMVGIGPTSVLDTYLTQEHFHGTGVSFLATVERQKPQSRWTTLLEHEANLATVRDRNHQERELEGVYNFYFGRYYCWHLLDRRLRLQAGALAHASLGFLYNTSNSNNPAQARAHLLLMPSAIASYGFHIGRLPVKARYELALPLIGVMFSPNYGQSYYEIFNRGNYDHNIVPTTFVSAPEWRQLLTLDVSLSHSTTLHLGYLGNMQQAKVNGLRQHVYTHRLLIGFTKQFSIVKR